MDDRTRYSAIRRYSGAERPVGATPRKTPASSNDQSGLRWEDADDSREPTGGKKKVSPSNKARAAALRKAGT